MQPIKWRMTYRYRIQEIKPTVPYIRPRKWSLNPNIPAVGDGTCEAWFVGPREGEEIRGVNLLYAIPEPTAVEKDLDGDVDLYYYDFTPQNSLPQEVQVAMQFEFITFERYTYWKGMPDPVYDKSSDFYKEYTAQEDPIIWNKEMTKAAKDFIPEDPNDVKLIALNTYNHIVCNYDYDWSQNITVPYFGYKGMDDSTRCWINKTGQCDEFSNLICSLLRVNGIPTRPVAGLVHDVIPAETGGSYLVLGGGHAWAEFYWPEVGWIPIDPTWGMSDRKEVVDQLYSLVGYRREIPQVDYYFGKTDPYRITLYKNWNIKLNPPPKTPKADKEEMWFVSYTDRMSGIQEMTYGWEGVPSMGG